MPYIKLGKKEKTYAEPTVSGGSKDKEIVRYPNFAIRDIPLPLTSKTVGKVITAEVQLRVNEAGPEIDEYNNKKNYRYGFSVMAINLGKKKVDISKMDSSDLDQMERNEHDKISIGKGLM